MLMRQRQRDAEPARLGERVGHVRRQVDVVLELVGEDGDGVTSGRIDSRSPERRLPKLPDEERADERGGLRADYTTPQRDKHNPALGEDLLDAKAGREL